MRRTRCHRAVMHRTILPTCVCCAGWGAFHTFESHFSWGHKTVGCGPGLGISDAHLLFFNSIGILAVKIENGFGRLGPFLWLVLQQIAKMPTPPVELKKASYFKH